MPPRRPPWPRRGACSISNTRARWSSRPDSRCASPESAGVQSPPDLMPLHIGIVACSAEGAALCYRTICVEGAALLGAHDHPEISMHTHSLAAYMKRIYRDDWAGVAELMLSSAEKLARTGCDFLICP